MRGLDTLEVREISGGVFHFPAMKIDAGTVAATCAIGTITTGPIGIGYCIGGVIVRHAVNELVDLNNA